MSDYIELPMRGLDAPLSEMELAVQESAHRFAEEVLRPVGTQLDRMTAEDAIAPDSPLWDAAKQMKGLGFDLASMIDMDPIERARLMCIINEELCWGDLGLANVMLVDNFPVMFALAAGKPDLAEYCIGKRGCWAITEPDHGTDMLDAANTLGAPGGEYGRPNCIAKIDGDKVIVNGQKSSWVSGAMTAEVAVLFCHADLGGGKTGPGIAVMVPLDLPGISRGKPLEKMGVRALNQGEIFFDNVEVPIDNLLAGPDTYQELAYHMLSEANPHVGLFFVGLARAAYEHALAYAHERKQGGVPIIQHQNVRYRLFHMFRKVEVSRAMVWRAMEYNITAPRPAMHGSIAAKVTATQNAFEVANDALQIFGGNGMTHEYPLEKLLRDARSGLIADGCNEVLALKGGSFLVNPDLL